MEVIAKGKKKLLLPLVFLIFKGFWFILDKQSSFYISFLKWVFLTFLHQCLKRSFLSIFNYQYSFPFVCMTSLLVTYCQRSGFTAKKAHPKKTHQHQPCTHQVSFLFLFIHTNRKGFTSWKPYFFFNKPYLRAEISLLPHQEFQVGQVERFN